MLAIVSPADYGLAAGGGLSPVDSTFSVVVLVALSGVVSTFCSTVVVVSPPGVVTVVSVFFSVVAVGWQPMVATPTMQATVKNKMFFTAKSPEERMGSGGRSARLLVMIPQCNKHSRSIQDSQRSGSIGWNEPSQTHRSIKSARGHVRDCRATSLTVRTRSLGEAVDR